MNKPADRRRIVVGAIAGAHGVRGDVRVKSFTAEPEACFKYGPLTDAAGKPVMTPKSVRAAKSHFIIVPELPRQKEEWDSLKGALLYVPRDVLPETDADEYYLTDLVGLDVFAGGDAPIGKVKSVEDFGAGEIVEIALESGEAVMLPFTREDVPAVDLAAGRIVVSTLDLWRIDPNEKRPPDVK